MGVMEGLQEEADKLLDIITVLLIKLEEAGDNDVSEIKLILDKSKKEIVLIRDSIENKCQETDGDIEDDGIDSEIKHEEIETNESSKLNIEIRDYEYKLEGDCDDDQDEDFMDDEPPIKLEEAEEDIDSTVKISSQKQTRKKTSKYSGGIKNFNDKFYKIRKCISC